MVERDTSAWKVTYIMPIHYKYPTSVYITVSFILKNKLFETFIAPKNLDAIIKRPHPIALTSWQGSVMVNDRRGGRVRSGSYALIQFGGDSDFVKTWERANHSNAGKDLAVQWIDK